MAISERQKDEILALESIYEDFYMNQETGTGIISIKTALENPVLVKFEDSEAKVSHLPPISLKINLRKEYPESAPPFLTLSCCWLELDKLEKLAELLLDTFEKDEEVLFLWINLIRDELAEILELSKFGVLIRKSQKKTVKKLECGNVLRSEYRDGAAMFSNLVEFNSSAKKQEFNAKYVDCQICLFSKQGEKCEMLFCGHVFCKECLAQFFKVLIQEGSVLSLKCPECSEPVNYSTLKSCVSEELFGRFEALMFQKGLDGMDDIAYCPRASCRMPTIVLSKQDRIALCSVCQFAFCNLCFRSSHFPAPCPVNSREAKRIISEYEAAEKAGNNKKIQEIVAKYGKNITTIIEQHKSMSFIRENSVPCPKCNQAIIKSDGCNKMVCGTCGTYFCYLCGRIVDKANPYSHFNANNSQCFGRLFEGATVDAALDEYFDFIL